MSDKLPDENQTEGNKQSFVDKLTGMIPPQIRLPLLTIASTCGLITLLMNSGFNEPSEIERIIVKINANPQDIPALIRDFNLEVPEEYLSIIEISDSITLELGLDTNGDKFSDSEISIVSDGQSLPVINLQRYGGDSSSNVPLNLGQAASANLNGVSIEVQRTVFENEACVLTHSLRLGTLENGEFESSENRFNYYENRNEYFIQDKNSSAEPISINNIDVPIMLPFVTYGDNEYEFIDLLPATVAEEMIDCIDAYKYDAFDLEG